jgi:translation initiation factor IF-2
MFNERGQRVKEIGPSQAATILGLNGAPTAGDAFHVMDTDQEAREIANKREQLAREQGIRTMKRVDLNEIGRRIALGNFKELNIIVKGDVDGSIEALSDALLKLSTEKIQVNVIQKSVGQISENDVNLAAASDAIIVAFQVRPSGAARKLAEQEGVDIRTYSVIYDAIEEVRDAMEGMLSPDLREEVTGTAEIRQVFKISKVGSIAGCFVTDGKIYRTSKVRVIRDGIVVFTGELGSLKQYKDDVKDISKGQECGLNIDNFNDIAEGDVIEAYEVKEIKRKLE